MPTRKPPSNSSSKNGDPKPEQTTPEGKRSLIQDYMDRYPGLRYRIVQNFLIRLHSSGIKTIDEIYKDALGTSVKATNAYEAVAMNVDSAVQFSKSDRASLRDSVLKYAAEHFSIDEIEEVVVLTAKREEVQNLEDIANLPGISFGVLKRKLEDFCRFPKTAMRLPPSDAIATRVALMRQFVSDHMDFLKVARNHIQIRDLNDIANRTIGNEEGIGRIGGKAAGLILAKKIIEDHYEEKGEKPEIPIVVPNSFYLRSDVNRDFVRDNGLMRYAGHKYRSQEEIEAEHPLIFELFHSGTFSEEVVDKVRALLKDLGPVPLIVRSSSLLEDQLGAAFSGKYRSIFLANQGSLEERTDRFLSAVVEVYASVLGADPILYRQERNLVDYDEYMAILVQPVVGRQHGDYFFPLFAGVAFSQNDFYRWSPRIKKEDGIVRLVMGLGTRAVDRVSSDYPRMVALSAPTLRPQGDFREIKKKSQRSIDVLNLRENRFETLPTAKVVGSNVPPHFNLVGSIVQDDSFSPIIGDMVDPSEQEICLTFDKLIESTPFTSQVKEILKALEGAYGCPVDIEFACDGEFFYLLQCRPLASLIDREHVSIPAGLDPSQVLFRATKDIRNGALRNIEYIVHVPFDAYQAIAEPTKKQMVARIVGKLNQALKDNEFILLGPGRWGSNDLNLGVKVNYADIRNTRALIEVAREKDGYVPEVSYGTHFFQDLVEADISYLPLFPNEGNNKFHDDFFFESENSLMKVLPDAEDFKDLVRVLHIPTLTDGCFAHLIMDGDAEKAVCYISERSKENGI